MHATAIVLSEQLETTDAWRRVLPPDCDWQGFTPSPSLNAGIPPRENALLLACANRARPAVLIVDARRGRADWMSCIPVGPPRLVIGDGDVAADVSLPADFHPRELATAFRLLAEIDQFRRGSSPPYRSEDPLNDLAWVDELTSLPNRRAWNEELSRRLHDPRTGRGLCLAIFDLDHFKQINSGWGHAAGDRLLAATARGLAECIRPEDFLARLGGDEFGMLLRDVAPEGAALAIERIRQRLPALVGRTEPHVAGCSVGYVVVATPFAGNVEQLLASADQALRLAKQQGRDTSIRASNLDPVTR